MRNPLTKAPDTKNENVMNPEFKTILDVAARISSEAPAKRDELLRGIEQAQRDQIQAASAKEAAKTNEQFYKACDFESHAKEREAFLKRQLDDLQYTPRMDESDYNAAVSKVDSVVLSAAESFREIASSAMRSIVQARSEYMKTLRDADKTLISLDAAANVLQSKYRYQVLKYTDGSEDRREDPSEWKRHITRYKDGKGLMYAVRDPKKERPSAWVAYVTDEYLAEAWRAAERVSE